MAPNGRNRVTDRSRPGKGSGDILGGRTEPHRAAGKLYITRLMSSALSRLEREGSMRAMLRVAGVFVALMTSPAGAEPDSIGTWLMKQPLTLWDIGIIRARDEAAQAIKYVGQHRSTKGLTSGGVQYRWEKNEIEIVMNIWSYNDTPSHENCNMIRRYVISYLGAVDIENEEAARDSLHGSIAGWF